VILTVIKLDLPGATDRDDCIHRIEYNMKWKTVTDDDVETMPYEPWVIDCPNQDCGDSITLSGSGGPSDLTCPSCQTEIEVAVRFLEINTAQETQHCNRNHETKQRR